MPPVSDDLIWLILASSAAVMLQWLSDRQLITQPVSNSARQTHRHNVYHRIFGQSDTYCVHELRMRRQLFFNLCDILRERDLLRDTIHVCVEEQLAMFLNTVGHASRNRDFVDNCYRSGETVSRYFHLVLHAIGALKNDFIIGPSNVTHQKILDNPAYYPFFKDCVGAIDGTHISASLPANEVNRFRGRKGTPTQNVLAAVDFDTQFTYVLAGWEGSTHDATVLRSAIERPNGLQVPQGKYYIADAGYATRDGFITPYRGTRYHLNQFEGGGPQNYKELFNYRHSSLRMTVERSFGILKNRFNILQETPYFDFPTQVKLVLVCCTLHNYISSFGMDEITEEVEEWVPHNLRHTGMSQVEIRESQNEWVNKRDQIAMAMWDDY